MLIGRSLKRYGQSEPHQRCAQTDLPLKERHTLPSACWWASRWTAVWKLLTVISRRGSCICNALTRGYSQAQLSATEPVRSIGSRSKGRQAAKRGAVRKSARSVQLQPPTWRRCSVPLGLRYFFFHYYYRRYASSSTVHSRLQDWPCCTLRPSWSTRVGEKEELFSGWFRCSVWRWSCSQAWTTSPSIHD